MYPELFTIGGFTLESYGLCLALAYLVAIELGIRKAEARGEDPKLIGNFVVVLVLAAFAGGRALFVWLEWDDLFAADPLRVFKIWEGGLVFYGGLIGAFSACFVYVKMTGLKVLDLADYAMPSVMIGQAIGRVGCLLVGCCYGAPWSGPVAIHLHGAWRHPVQAYATVSLFFGWLLLEWVYRRYQRAKPGLVLVIYMAYQCWHRYLLETYRVDDRGGTFFFGLTISQNIALALGAGALVLLVVLKLFFWGNGGEPVSADGGASEPAKAAEAGPVGADGTPGDPAPGGPAAAPDRPGGGAAKRRKRKKRK